MKKILIVDDEINIRFLYKEEFEEEGYAVVLASDAEEALEMIGKEKPDLICLDIKLPGMDGIEFMNIVMHEFPDIPVIFCSAFAHYKQDFRVWSAKSYWIKSANLNELKKRVKEILSPQPAETASSC